MSVKSVAALRPVPLPNAMTQNNKEARADIIRNLSASAAWVVGYTVGGEDLDTDTVNTSPRSPMHGLRGHTHSGGLDGRPMFRTIASATFDDNGTWSANVETCPPLNRSAAFNARAQGSPLSFPLQDPGDGLGKFLSLGPPLPVWVPGCDPRVGAYISLGWRAHIEFTLATNVSSGDRFTLRLTNLTTGATAEDNRTSIAVGRTAALASDTERLAVLPGQYNLLQVSAELYADAVSAVGVRAVAASIFGLELGVHIDEV